MKRKILNSNENGMHLLRKLKGLLANADNSITYDIVIEELPVREMTENVMSNGNRQINNGLYLTERKHIELLIYLKEILKIIDGVDRDE
jgi:hypothetical protein